MIVITQKQAVLRDVDNIMLLADGQIAMFGARDQMLEKLALQRQADGALPNAVPPAPQG